MNFSVAQQSNQGGRDYNEDRTAIFIRGNTQLLVVADGLGGHAGGDIASQAFVDAMGASFAKASTSQLKNADDFLTLSINYAHHIIHRRAVSLGFDAESPKTTCVVCLINDGVAQWAHSGDSRLYLIRQRAIIGRTKDHVSKVSNASGNSPINRCVGGVETPKPDVSRPEELEEGDIFVLASDGAWANFKPIDLRDYVDPDHPTFGLDSLLQTLEKRNKTPSDNLSMVLLYWGREQHDNPILSDMPMNTETRGADFSNQKPRKRKSTPFDMGELDSTISEIESFITDLDDKL